MCAASDSMPVVHYPQHDQHDEKNMLSEGQVQPTLETPVRIYTVLDRLGSDERFDLLPAEPIDPAELTSIHSPEYVHFLEWMSRQAQDTVDGARLIPYEFAINPLAPPPEKMNLHQAGRYCADTITPIGPGTWQAALGAAGATAEGARLVRQGRRCVYVACRPPGHHAGRARCAGFCYVNNSALAAEILSGHGSVAVLDIDTHHGNGTQEIFYSRGDVLFVSVHGDPAGTYPFFWGSSAEKGTGDGAGSNVNLPLAVDAGPEQWFGALDEALGIVAGSGPQRLVVSFGSDVRPGEPVTGGFGLDASDLTEAGRRIRSLDLPTLVVQEGGYQPDVLAETVHSFLAGLLG
ncbi:MAG: histone deacetylase family protein [Phycisphaerae bacterium]